MDGLPDFVALDWNGTVVPFFHEAPYPGALEVIRGWRRAGLWVAVVSHAGPAAIEADVRRVGLEADEVLGVRDKGPAFLELRLRHGRGVVLGDHPADLRAAAAAELPFLQARLAGQPAFPGSAGGFTDWREAELLLRGICAESARPPEAPS
ncbi:MAG: HAD family hydrolase [Planctomycetota bacterium]|nr:MAG: HAD family hydrolase [Planctomycetota bacterium]